MKVDCNWEGYFKHYHKIMESRLYKDNGRKDIDLFIEALEKYLTEAYLGHYGKLIIVCFLDGSLIIVFNFLCKRKEE